MIKSMSGHGRAEASDDSLRITVEVRSVNHRYGRVSVRLPAELAALEDQVRRQVQGVVQRGKVDVSASLAGTTGQGVHFDQAAAAAWLRDLQALTDSQGLAEGPRVGDVLSLPGVLTTDGSAAIGENAAELLASAVAEAVAAFDDMRRREGDDLAADLVGRTAAMRATIENVAVAAEELPGRIRDQLRQRIADLLADTGAEVSDERIAQEAAYHAERADVTEEIVRLRSHLEKVDELLASDDAVGRTLEFVTQEIHRELNTIGSKTKDLDVADAIVGLKAELERVREQVQNIE